MYSSLKTTHINDYHSGCRFEQQCCPTFFCGWCGRRWRPVCTWATRRPRQTWSQYAWSCLQDWQSTTARSPILQLFLLYLYYRIFNLTLQNGVMLHRNILCHIMNGFIDIPKNTLEINKCFLLDIKGIQKHKMKV